jgi:hypothetical protein
MGDPPCGVKVNDDDVMVEPFIGSLKMTETLVVTDTPLLPFVGVTEVTVGTGLVAVENVHA